MLVLALGWPQGRAVGQGAGGGPQTLRDGPFVAHYWPGHRRMAERLLRTARQAAELPALPPGVLEAGGDVKIYLAPDARRFDSLTAGQAPEWGAGIAVPATGTIVLPVYGSDRAAPHELHGILRHELAHVALHRYLEPARIPRWFDEGYARWAAGEWGFEAAWHLRLAFLLHRAPPLDSLRLGWPAREVDARVAYLLSTSAVGYLVEQGGGVRGLGLFLERWKESGSLDAALRRTYGLTLGQFEEDWKRDVKDSYGWTFFVSYTMLFWAFAAMVLLALFAIRRRRDLERLEHLRATEPPDDPAFWLYDEDPWEADDPGDPDAAPS